MAKVFVIRDNDGENCPRGLVEAYTEEYMKKNPDDPKCERAEFEENWPTCIHDMEYDEQLKWAYKVLKANNAKPNHGDVIWIGGDVYRNDGIHFWDAKNEKIVPMETKICDYGHVPKRFAVGKGEGEFRSTHWDGISYYNNLEPVWSSKKKQWFYPSEGEYVSDTDSDSE